jgi:hypothetical protein
MSAHDHESEAAHPADPHADHEQFDDEPVNELGLDEPPSPTWLPLIGGVFLVLGGGFWLLGDGDDPAAPTLGSAASAAAAPAAASSGGGPNATDPRAAPAKRPKISREQLIDLRRRAQGAAGEAQPSGAPARPPAPEPPQPPGR